MTIVILSRLVTNCKAAEVHSEHKSWIDGKLVHDYRKELKNCDAALAEHGRLEQYALQFPDYWKPKWEP